MALIRMHGRSKAARIETDINDGAAGLSAGKKVGPYVVVDRLGRGGMAKCFSRETRVWIGSLR
jgi:hypothetical protein